MFELHALPDSSVSFGRELKEIDLSRLSESLAAELVELLFRYQLLVFREQVLTPEAHVRLGAAFGSLDRYPLDTGAGSTAEMYRTSNRRERGVVGQAAYWHVDGYNFPSVPLIAVYRMVDLPSAGAETRFLSGYEALVRLPRDLRRIVESVEFEAVAGRPHRGVLAHPVTGRMALSVRTVLERGVVAWRHGESVRLLAELEEALNEQSGFYAHRWRSGDVLVADNQSVLHRATAFGGREPRTMHRVTITRPRTLLHAFPGERQP
jgi:alpha-ketoglutarate-dependent taurine dioxygenase